MDDEAAGGARRAATATVRALRRRQERPVRRVRLRPRRPLRGNERRQSYTSTLIVRAAIPPQDPYTRLHSAVCHRGRSSRPSVRRYQSRIGRRANTTAPCGTPCHISSVTPHPSRPRTRRHHRPALRRSARCERLSPRAAPSRSSMTSCATTSLQCYGCRRHRP